MYWWNHYKDRLGHKVNMLKGPKHLWNLHESTFIIFLHHSEGKSFGKYLPYLILNIGVFVNTWTADYKYSVPDCENLQFPIQMQLS